MKCVPITLVMDPGEKYQLPHRYWQGCPTILRTPGGRIFAGWYSGGVREPDPANYNLLISSDDNGWHWSDPLLVVPSEPEKGFIAVDIQLWLDPLSRMWLFVTQRYLDQPDCSPGHLALWAVRCDDPDAPELVWSEPQYIAPGFLRTQPTALSNGDWVLCAYNWATENYCYARSSDQGKSWQMCQAGKKQTPDFDESMIFEREDHTLVLMARDIKPLLVQSESSDLAGSSWTPGKHTRILTATSRIFVKRLRSGKLLLIHNDAANFRTNMVAELSEDDGRSWKYSLLLDKVELHQYGVSYPDAVEDADGNIYILYDRGRSTSREIIMAQITEADIMAGYLCTDSSYLHRIISKAPAPADMEKYEQEKAKSGKWINEVFDPLLVKITAVRKENR